MGNIWLQDCAAGAQLAEDNVVQARATMSCAARIVTNPRRRATIWQQLRPIVRDVGRARWRGFNRHHERFYSMKKVLLATFAVLALSAGAFHAYAQMPSHGDPVAMIAALNDKLSLNTSQQLQWDSAVAQTRSARDAAHASFAQLKTATQTELAKPEPDLAALAAQADAVHAQNALTRKAVRDTWLALYATFTPDQKVIVRDAILAKLARMEKFRAHMMQRHAQ
ncbi:MAG: periplasmic heavy metal sensor [Casimicrobiaceae bacterium]